MVGYLAIGPLRNRISKRTEAALPLATDWDLLSCSLQRCSMRPTKFGELAGLSPHVIDRRVRDGLDAARQRLGPIAKEGAQGMQAELVRLLRIRAGVGK